MKIHGTRKIILYITIIMLVIVVSILSQIILFSYSISENRILPGVYINDFYVGGKTKDEAYEALDNNLAELLLNNNTTIRNGDAEFTIHASDIANIDINALVDEAYMARRENKKINYFQFLKMKLSPVNIKSPAILDWQNIYDSIEMEQHLFYMSPVDAQLLDYSFIDGQLKVIASPSENGYCIDVYDTATAVQHSLANHIEYTDAVMEILEPSVRTEELITMGDNPISYSQVFPETEDGKFKNIQQSLSQLNTYTEPMLIVPGQSVSIKEFIHYNEYNPDIHSIKQIHIPSVIYGCALHLGLTADKHKTSDYITEDMDYYAYGQEATLTETDDLILTNNFSYPVIIDLKYDNTGYSSKLVCKIYYVQSLEYTYIRSVIEKQDSMYYVKVYRIYANDTGGVLSRTLLDEHYYPIPVKKPEVSEENIEQGD